MVKKKKRIKSRFSRFSKKIESEKLIEKIFLLKVIIIIIMFLFLFSFIMNNHNLKDIKMINNNIKKFYNISYENSQFAILRRTSCSHCGLLSFYVVHLGCTNKYISMGYIPIVDVMSFPNVFNKYKKSNNNSMWESLFYQPFGFTLEEVLKNAKNITYFECVDSEIRPSTHTFYYNKVLIIFWREIATKYMPVKNEIIKEANSVMKNLFEGKSNILGIKMRGTDYLSHVPSHPKPPSSEMVIKDAKDLYNKYKYDWIFLSTEDEEIKKNFIKEFYNIIKLYNPKEKIIYDYKHKETIMFNKDIIGNLGYAKNYLINIIILSKCTDFISAKGGAAVGVFLFTKGFRYHHIYDLGYYQNN